MKESTDHIPLDRYSNYYSNLAIKTADIVFVLNDLKEQEEEQEEEDSGSSSDQEVQNITIPERASPSGDDKTNPIPVNTILIVTGSFIGSAFLCLTCKKCKHHSSKKLWRRDNLRTISKSKELALSNIKEVVTEL